MSKFQHWGIIHKYGCCFINQTKNQFNKKIFLINNDNELNMEKRLKSLELFERFLKINVVDVELFEKFSKENELEENDNGELEEGNVAKYQVIAKQGDKENHVWERIGIFSKY
nr:511_t:CDS:2 [Entrophospora candida]